MEDHSAIQDELVSRYRSYRDFSVYSLKNKTNIASEAIMLFIFETVLITYKARTRLFENEG